jgi:protein-tyrosine phosphatase
MNLTAEAHLPARRLQLEGAANFRDLGGYRAQDGRPVAWRRLFRSDSLADITESDLKRIAVLGLRTVCDLRHEDERRRSPDRLPPDPFLRVRAMGFFPRGAKEMLSGINSGQLDAQAIACSLRDHYRRFPLDNADEFRSVVASLLEPDALPAVIHCTSGKDRTGFAVAIILMVLGIPRKTIVADYLLSNLYQRDLSFMLVPSVGPEAVAALTQVDPTFLGAAFETIDKTWGSDDVFLAESLRLTAKERQRLQEILLESSDAALGLHDTGRFR